MNSLVWLRRDLRLDDNPALSIAAKSGGVVPLFIFEPSENYGSASRWWLHHSLKSFSDQLEGIGSKLLIQKGEPAEILPKVCKDLQIDHVYWNRRYEPLGVQVDSDLIKVLSDAGIQQKTCRGNLLYEPEEIKNKQGGVYQVFTPFWRALRERKSPIKADAAVKKLSAPSQSMKGLQLEDLNLLPHINWDSEFTNIWKPGIAGARENLKDFLNDSVRAYKMQRDFPNIPATSLLSPHLHFGEISSRRIWSFVHEKLPRKQEGRDHFLSELGWREFSHYLLFHFPYLVDEPLREEFKKFKWKKNQKALKSWQQGKTGYPIVDAGMRQLWNTGWMHNRIRMIVASFLIKDLLIHWKEGADWFWDTLVDADIANNTMGWQWTAGCGADASPYFRIFNPCLQSKKYDPDGAYIKTWVPELSKIPAKHIHAPWQAPNEVLEQAKVSMPRDYPLPIVDHAEARDRALELYKELRA